MRVQVWPADQAGCGHYRLMFPGIALQEQGADVVIDTAGPRVQWDQVWHGDSPPPHVNAVGLDTVPDTDVVVMQRPSRRWWCDIIPMLQRHGIRVVVDVDDLFDKIHKGNIGHGSYERRHVNHRWIDHACKLADAVTATTPALVKRYGHGHGHLLPNLVPARYFDIEPKDRTGNVVGWPGFVGNHPADLQATLGAVPAVLARHGCRFRVVGPPDGVAPALGLRDEPEATGWLPFDDYIAGVAGLDVGIVPLEDSAFNQAKSALKASEMASVGVPMVMSPTCDNLRLHRLGVGLVAQSRGQWARHLGALCASSGLREDLAGRGRRIMAQHTYETRCGDWWSVWTGKDQ